LERVELTALPESLRQWSKPERKEQVLCRLTKALAQMLKAWPHGIRQERANWRMQAGQP